MAMSNQPAVTANVKPTTHYCIPDRSLPSPDPLCPWSSVLIEFASFRNSTIMCWWRRYALFTALTSISPHQSMHVSMAVSSG